MWRIQLIMALLLAAITSWSQNIDFAEYFIDTDPGHGNGTEITGFTPADVVSLNFTVPTNSLSTGFHFLSVRVRDTDGLWSLFDHRGFYISPATTEMPQIVEAEYFIDTDPGVGNGTEITGFSPGNTVNLIVSIPTDNLSAGFHFLSVRVKDENGRWSLFDQRGFLIDNAVAEMPEIVEAEYFIDSDPGAGNGIAITGFSPGNTVNLAASISTDNLSGGFHFLAIRVKDASGRWSLFDQRGFFVETAPDDMPEIVKAEYFIDTDPGPGNGTLITGFTPDNIVNLVASISTNSLSSGFHFLTVRVQDAIGNWSLFDRRGFYIQPAPVDMTAIVSAEYFVNTDPGPGNGIELDVDPDGNIIMEVFNIAISETAALGPGFYGFRVQDADGNWSLVAYDTVTVAIRAPADVTVTAAADQCSAVVNNIDPDVFNNAPFTYTLFGATTGSGSGTASGLAFNTGITTVRYALQSDTSVFSEVIVTVIDEQLPIITCPANITANNTNGLCGATVNFTVTSDDNCPGETISLVSGLASGSVFPVGLTTNIFQVADASGNVSSCSFTVTIIDTQVPSVNCPANITASASPGLCTAVVNYSVTVDDNCPGAILTQTLGLPSGSTFPIGTTTNVFEATDVAGNTSTCSFDVIIIDSESPVLSCNSIEVNNDPGMCGAVVSFTVTATDNCDANVTVMQSSGLASGSTFPVGISIVSFQAQDDAGNTSTCDFTITVVDNELPVVDCPNDFVVNETPNQNGAIVNYTVNSDDNCAGETLTQLTGLPSGSFFPVGTTINTFEAEDVSGNSSSCSFSITVLDDGGAPTILCPDDVSMTLVPGECTVIVPDIDPVVSPPDTPYTYTLTGATSGNGDGSASGLSFDPGITTVTYTITGSGIQCSFTVTINLNPEICNGVDDDCDGLVDDDDPDIAGQQTWYADTDNDGFGDANASVDACSQPPGFVGNDDDCDDTNILVHPDAQEVCNGIDDDCDGLVDDDDPSIAGQSTWFADADGDGFGDAGSSVPACNAPTGFVANDDDCDDTDVLVNPDAQEICNGIDDDCDGLVDDDDPSVSGQSSWFADADGDGFGDASSSVLACDAPMDFVENDGDCDDTNELVNPDAQEICNGIDDDCDGLVDGDDPSVSGLATWYADADGDGFGDPGDSLITCDQPAGYVINDDDCDDTDENIHPGATEICNGVDDDCDGLVDEGVGQIWFADSDADGFGDSGNSQTACDQPGGFVSDNTDCDDTDPLVNPDAVEVCNDIDDDCDGLIDEGVLLTWFADTDGDGFGNPNNSQMACSQPAGYVSNNTDCNDGNGSIHPGATELCNNVDDDCDGIVDDGCPPSGQVLISIEDSTYVQESAGFVDVYVYLSEPSSEIVRVAWKTMNGTAQKIIDYKAANGILRFLPGQTVGIIRVILTVDNISEPEEYFKIVLSSPVNAVIQVGTGFVFIQETGGPSFSSMPEAHELSVSNEIQATVPNPQSNDGNLLVRDPHKNPYDIVLMDFLGRVVVTRKNYQNDWSMTELAAGIYFYVITSINQEGILIRRMGQLIVTD